MARLVRRASEGERAALDAVVRILYDELRARARGHRARWRGDQTMDTTALVHEVYLRLVAHDDPNWESRAHFLAMSSRAMRQILVDYARRRGARKRGGNWDRVTLDEVDQLCPALCELPGDQAEALIELDVCLGRLEGESPSHGRIVECRFFGGMTIEETAEALHVSTATVKRGWNLARAWLHREMRPAASR